MSEHVAGVTTSSMQHAATSPGVALSHGSAAQLLLPALAVSYDLPAPQNAALAVASPMSPHGEPAMQQVLTSPALALLHGLLSQLLPALSALYDLPAPQKVAASAMSAHVSGVTAAQQAG